MSHFTPSATPPLSLSNTDPNSYPSQPSLSPYISHPSCNKYTYLHHLQHLKYLIYWIFLGTRFDVPHSATFAISNTSGQYKYVVKFKIPSTDRELWTIEPNSTVIQPGQSATITITLKAFTTRDIWRFCGWGQMDQGLSAQAWTGSRSQSYCQWVGKYTHIILANTLIQTNLFTIQRARSSDHRPAWGQPLWRCHKETEVPSHVLGSGGKLTMTSELSYKPKKTKYTPAAFPT